MNPALVIMMIYSSLHNHILFVQLLKVGSTFPLLGLSPPLDPLASSVTVTSHILFCSLSRSCGVLAKTTVKYEKAASLHLPKCRQVSSVYCTAPTQVPCPQARLIFLRGICVAFA